MGKDEVKFLIDTYFENTIVIDRPIIREEPKN